MNTQAHGQAQTILRETGIALAVLAVYVLTLLLPLHQAAALQRDLNAAGFSTLDNWSVCQPLAQDENGDPRQAAALDCPATGAGKHELAAVLPPVPAVLPPARAFAIAPLAAPLLHVLALPSHVGQSRAPPVAV